MDIHELIKEIEQWTETKWNHHSRYHKNKIISLTFDLGFLAKGMSPYAFCTETVASILGKICQILESTNQEFPEHIKNAILLHSL